MEVVDPREKEEPFVIVMESAPPFPLMHVQPTNEAEEMWRGSEGTTLISTTAPFPRDRVMFVNEHSPLMWRILEEGRMSGEEVRAMSETASESTSSVPFDAVRSGEERGDVIPSLDAFTLTSCRHTVDVVEVERKMEWPIGYADVDVRESVSFLNVSIISVPAAVKRLLYDCIVTPLTLSTVESIPEP